MNYLGYILVWAGTMASMSLGFVFGKPWIDRRLAKKPVQKPQQGGTMP